MKYHKRRSKKLSIVVCKAILLLYLLVLIVGEVEKEEKKKIIPVPHSTSLQQSLWHSTRRLSDPQEARKIFPGIGLLTARRNQDCVVHDHRIYHFLGRWANDVEFFDMISGEQAVLTETPRTEERLLHSNHVVVVPVSSLEGNSTEFWVPCGFHGDVVNDEISEDTVIIAEVLSKESLQILTRKGPRLDLPRGACSALALKIKNAAEDVCVFGGSSGKHDNGIFRSNISCWDRVGGHWHYPFPNFPVGFDHGSIIHIPPSTCSEGVQLAGKIIITDFRTESYGEGSTKFWALDLETESSGNVKAIGNWYILGQRSPDPCGFAGVNAGGFALSGDGRFLYTFGGRTKVHCIEKDSGCSERMRAVISNEVSAFSLCHLKHIRYIDFLSIGRFALKSCSGDGVYVTCGGHEQGAARKNSRTCDFFAISSLDKKANELLSLELLGQRNISHDAPNWLSWNNSALWSPSGNIKDVQCKCSQSQTCAGFLGTRVP